MKFTLARTGALLGALGIAVAGLLTGTGGVSASPASVGLFPGVGSTATGGGSILFNPTMSPLSITVNIAGAKPSTTFTVAACSTFGGCVNSGAASQFTTDALGNATVTVSDPGITPVALITATDNGNATDNFAANTAGFGIQNFSPFVPFTGFSPFAGYSPFTVLSPFSFPFFGFTPTVGAFGTPYSGFWIAPGGATFLAPASYSPCPVNGVPQGNQNSPRANPCFGP